MNKLCFLSYDIIAGTSTQETKHHTQRAEDSGLLRWRAQRSYHSKLWAPNKGITEFL